MFVDVSPNLVGALNEKRAYTIQIVGSQPETVAIDNVRALMGTDRERVAEEIATASVLCTAVGAGALRHIAPTVAEGLLLRKRQGGERINILLCENLHGADWKFREMVAGHLPAEERDAVIAATGFVQAVVSRMVPVQTAADTEDDPLPVRVEAYKRLPIDKDSVVGTLPPLIGVEPVSPFAAYVERKLYTHNCAHAVLGYLGYIAGHRFGYEALRDPRIASLLRAVLAETGEALIRRHGFEPQAHRAHVDDLLARFQNEALGDTCRRLARDPLRKLAADDRLTGAARLCEAEGVPPHALAWAIAAALRYDDPEDPSAVEMQRILRSEGFDAGLQRITAIRTDENLAELVREASMVSFPSLSQFQ